jgi:hypothetical protein
VTRLKRKLADPNTGRYQGTQTATSITKGKRSPRGPGRARGTLQAGGLLHHPPLDPESSSRGAQIRTGGPPAPKAAPRLPAPLAAVSAGEEHRLGSGISRRGLATPRARPGRPRRLRMDAILDASWCSRIRLRTSVRTRPDLTATSPPRADSRSLSYADLRFCDCRPPPGHANARPEVDHSVPLLPGYPGTMTGAVGSRPDLFHEASNCRG